MKTITLMMLVYMCFLKIPIQAQHSQEFNIQINKYPLHMAMQYKRISQDLQTDSIIVYSFSSSNDSLPAFKSIFANQPEAAQSIETIFEWNVSGKNWQKILKKEIKKDANGNVFYTALYSWDAVSNQWICQNINENIVDASGNVLVNAYYNLRNWNGQEEGYRIEHTYNAQGLQTSQEIFIWDIQSKQWLARNKETWEFDESGLMLAHHYYEWHTGNNDWNLSNHYKYAYEFNAQGKITSKVVSKWDVPSATWQQASRYLYTYNDQNYLVNELLFYGTNSWASTRIDYENDTNGNAILVIKYIRSKDVWKEDTKNEYAFDANGNQTLSAWYNWDDALNSWNGMNKTESAFDENGNNILFISYQWNVNTLNWVPANKQERHISIDGLLVQSTGFRWNMDSQDWVYVSKNEEQKDQSGNVVLQANYNWDIALKQWTTNFMSKYDYTYNNEGYVENIVVFEWNNAKSELMLTQKMYYFYSFKTSREIIMEIQSFTIYPNPVNDFLFINGAESKSIIIEDSMGKIWMNFINRQGVVDVKELPDGIYFIRIAEGSKQQVKRFIKNKH